MVCVPNGKVHRVFAVMPREGTIIFRDMAASSMFSASNAQVRPQRGRYYLHRLIERYGIDAKLSTGRTRSQPTARRKKARNLNDQCRARCPDLSKVV